MHDPEPSGCTSRSASPASSAAWTATASSSSRRSRPSEGAHNGLGPGRPLPVRLAPNAAARSHRGTRLSADARRILAVQAVRALAYGLGSVLIGVTLAARGLSDGAVGLVLASLLAGTALVSILIARYGDRVGRRRCYRLLLVAMALSGTVFALTDWLPMLILAGLTGALSTEVVESGPFTSLEQAMLPHAALQERTKLFGTYNTVATLAGSLGALITSSAAHLSGCSSTRSPPAQGSSPPRVSRPQSR